MDKKKTFPISSILRYLEDKNTFVLLESSLYDRQNHHSYIFTDPITIIRASSLPDIPGCLKAIESAQKQGLYVSGFISYEAGYAISEKLSGLKLDHPELPLIWMAVFRDPLIFDHHNNRFNKKSVFGCGLFQQSCELKKLKLDISKQQYINNVQKIKQLIARGDTYQVNYTTKYKFKVNGSALALYLRLRNNQPVRYGALLKSPDFNILSFSPELFFSRDKNSITVNPMKGTAARGASLAQDKLKQKQLSRDTKNRAENLMIVDLLRNDLGRISKTGTVKVNKLFNIEKYRTLLQMTSRISGRLKPDIGFEELFLSLFPSGSVTGAPKIRTMQIIRDLEPEPRGVYTGAIGFLSPKNKAVFNVAIRTIVLKENAGQMGVGSGITYSSDPESEYKECKLKADFLTMPAFKLIETMRWDKGCGIKLLDHHLNRLKQSCVFFGIKFSKKQVIRQINRAASDFNRDDDYRIRLLMDKDSFIEINSAAIDKKISEPARIALSGKKTQKDNIFLYHKNTHRDLYDRQYSYYKKLGFFDVIFTNRQNQITEGAISNIYIRKNGRLYTPPIKNGVLPGVYRTYLMSRPKDKPKEKVLYLEDLKKADAIYCSNAVRGMVRVELRLKKQY